MPHDDPLIRLLQTADAASTPHATSASLADRVRNRRAKQLARIRRLKTALCAVAVAGVVALIALLQPWQPAARRLPDSEIAALRAESDQLAAEADALERQVTAARLEQSRQDLREEYRRQLAANIDADTAQSPLDRAAAIALCQGDFYWEVQKNRAPAQAAYQSILDNFPTSPLASVAQARLQQLQMN